MVGSQTNVSDFFAAFAVASASYLSGDYGTIIFASLAASIWPIAGASTSSRLEGAVVLIKVVTMSVALTHPIAYALDKLANMPLEHTLSPISFFISVMGNRWMRVFDAASDTVTALVVELRKGIVKRLGKFLGGDQ